MADDLLKKTAVIQHYVMESKIGPYKPAKSTFLVMYYSMATYRFWPAMHELSLLLN